jgi:hypothetical protein
MSAKRRVDIVFVLGISAVDVLCCALVSSLVLFLLFSGSNLPLQGALGSGSNTDLSAVLRIDDSLKFDNSTRPLLRVRAFPPGSIPQRPSAAEFWTDSAPELTTRPSLREIFSKTPGGGIFWVPERGQVGGELARMCILHVSQPAVGLWDLEIGYMDTADGLTSAAVQSVPVRIAIVGHGQCEVAVTLDLGKAVRLSQLPPDAATGCSVKDVLELSAS